DARFEPERGRGGERLEAAEGQGLEVHAAGLYRPRRSHSTNARFHRRTAGAHQTLKTAKGCAGQGTRGAGRYAGASEAGKPRKKGRRGVPCTSDNMAGEMSGPTTAVLFVERCSDQVSAGSAWCASTLSMILS